MPSHKGKQIPLHHRILGRGAAELDTIDDLRLELEHAFKIDTIEYDDYLKCHDALDLREAKARTALEKATGVWIKPRKEQASIRGKPPSEPIKWKPWQVKLFLVFLVLLYLKIFSGGG